MNTINKILILLIIIFLINHLSNGQIIETVKTFFTKCSNKLEDFMGIINPQQSQLSNENNIIDESYDLNQFIKKLINSSDCFYQYTPSSKNRNLANESLVNNTMIQLIKILNSSVFRFENVKLLDDIYYHENQLCKEIEAFRISADVFGERNDVRSITMVFNAYLTNNNNLLKITNVKLLDIKNFQNIKKNEPIGCPNSPTVYQQQIKIKPNINQQKAIKKNNDMAQQMKETIDGLFIDRNEYDDLFIKPIESHNTDGFINDTDNSLIPSIVNVTTYEESSLTPISVADYQF